ncbi:M14 family metallopeptidase [Niabella terrae]
MARALLFLLLLLPLHLLSQLPATVFEQSAGRQTATYREIVHWWQQADQASEKIRVFKMGPTDAGKPLHLVIISNQQVKNPHQLKNEGQLVLLINNGIHPGEPDGIDASMLLARDIANGKIPLPDQLQLAIIPVYNIGGSLNRSENFRVDQNGPEAFGFRGNGQNLDLNRDFIKADSRNALSFAEIFHAVDPELFVDNHVSNGADYQHVMTLLTTQYQKLGGAMGQYLHEVMEPALYQLMQQKGYDLVPYVNFDHRQKVEQGWQGFWDAPRYSTGYAALWHSFGFMTETHMLKPYTQRVQSTYAMMVSMMEFAAINYKTIQRLRTEAIAASRQQAYFPLNWQLDSSRYSTIQFRGYQSEYRKSEVSGQPRLYYDRTRPYTRAIPFYDHYQSIDSAKRPSAYLIPQGWWKLTERLRANKIRMFPLEQDSLIQVEICHIESWSAAARPYEGHFLHRDLQTRTSHRLVRFRKGDWYIPMDQPANRYLMATLEPAAEDSYFRWNFFDAILQQKEGFSDYAFEPIAATYLQDHPDIRQQLEERRRRDSSFAKDGASQLRFVFRHSPFIEPAYLEYPVYRIP